MRGHPLSNTPKKALGKQLTTERTRNPLPSSEQYSAQTVKAIDERKNEQHGAIRGAMWRATLMKAVDERKYKQSAASCCAILCANCHKSR